MAATGSTDTTITPAREHSALEILRTRRLCVRPAEFLWRVENAKGQAVETQGYLDPVDALEGAERALQAAETRLQEKSAAKVVSALQQGVYMPWPRQTSTNIKAELNTPRSQQWNIIKTEDGSEVEVDGQTSWDSLQEALQNIVKLTEGSTFSADSKKTKDIT